MLLLPNDATQIKLTDKNVLLLELLGGIPKHLKPKCLIPKRLSSKHLNPKTSNTPKCLKKKRSKTQNI